MAQLKDTVISGSLRVTDTINVNNQVSISNTSDVSGTQAKTPALVIGTLGGEHLEFDKNEIMAKDGGTTTKPLYLNADGGVVYVGTSGLALNGKLVGSSATFGAALPQSASEGQIFFQVSEPWYEIPNGGTSGQALIKASNDSRDVTWGNVGGVMTPSNTKYYVSGSTTTTENTNPAVFNTNIFVENNVLMGAAWNDYAEYRQCNDKIEPGRCIVENGDGTLSLSTDRLQSGAEIVSDTFGFAIGKTTKSRTPVAISGRVLAYPYESLHKLKIGAPVCSGPNGTVSQMTDKEARKYPWLIIGTISAIPKEKEWGENKIKVNNRIWIRVR